MNKNLFHRGLSVFLISLLFLTACTKKGNDPQPNHIPSDACNLSSFRFNATQNPGLAGNFRAYFGPNNALYITIPEGASLTGLIPTFDISKGATLQADGTFITSTTSPLDCSSTVKLVCTAENGKTKTYYLLVQNGNPITDNAIYQFMCDYGIPGISFASTKNEAFTYQHAYGFACVETQERTRPDHLFRLASVSKQLTTLCIMTLYEEGKLGLDQTIFGPQGILADKWPTVSEKAAKVTIRHCLTHTTGWVSDPDPMFTSSFDGQTLDERIKYMLDSPQGNPGTKYSYYNMGFGVLGKVIEKITGQDYETYLRSILAKAGVTDIWVGKDRSGRRKNECVYYSQDGYNGYNHEMEVIKAAGGVIASAPELMRLMWHLDGREIYPDIISAETRATMFTPCSVYQRYALGWRCNHTYFPGAYYHTGNLSGTATFWVMGANGVNTVLLLNSRSYKKLSGRESFDNELYGLMKTLWNQAALL